MPEVVGTIRVVHVWGGAGAGAAGAGRATMIAAGGGAAAGGLLGASAGGGASGYLAGVRARAFIMPDSARGGAPFGMDPGKAAALFRNNQRALREWQAGASATKAWRIPRRSWGSYVKSRGGFLDFGGMRQRWRAANTARLQAAGGGWDPTAGPQPQYTTRMMRLGDLGQRLGKTAEKGIKGLSQIGKWFSGAGLTPQKLTRIGKFFKTIGERTGLVGGALGGLVRQIGAIGPAALMIGLAGKAVRDLGRHRQVAGAFQQRMAAAQGLGMGYAASQVMTEERQARYAVELVGPGTYAGQRGMLQQRMIRQRTRRQPGMLADWWTVKATDLSMGGTRVKGWFYKHPDPGIEKARRLHNLRWLAREVPQSWDALHDELRRRDDPFYRMMEEEKKLRPDLFGGAKRGFIPVSGQYGLAGGTATATAAQLTKEDLQNERDRIIYAVGLKAGLGD